MHNIAAKFGGVWTNTSEVEWVGKFTQTTKPQPTYMPDASQDKVKQKHQNIEFIEWL